MSTKTAREQSIAIGHLEDILFSSTISSKSTGNSLRPHGKILTGIKHHYGFARSTRRRMDAHNLGHGHSCQSEGIIITEVELIGKRQLDDIVNALDVTRLQPHLLELLPIEWGVVVHVLCHLDKTTALQFAKLFAVHAFNTLIPNHKSLSFVLWVCWVYAAKVHILFQTTKKKLQIFI